jgi:hypothetical protein
MITANRSIYDRKSVSIGHLEADTGAEIFDIQSPVYHTLASSSELD